jgi:hypothetical protein
VSQTFAEVVHAVISGHHPKEVAGSKVKCSCGWTGEGYPVHLASFIDGEMHAARYKVTDRGGSEVRFNY